VEWISEVYKPQIMVLTHVAYPGPSVVMILAEEGQMGVAEVVNAPKVSSIFYRRPLCAKTRTSGENGMNL